MHYTKKRLLIGALSIFLAAGSLCAAPVRAEETAQQPAVEDQTDADAPDQDTDASQDKDKDKKKTKKEKREEKKAKLSADWEGFKAKLKKKDTTEAQA